MSKLDFYDNSDACVLEYEFTIIYVIIEQRKINRVLGGDSVVEFLSDNGVWNTFCLVGLMFAKLRVKRYS